MAKARRNPEDKAMHMTTLIANFAAWGCPAPSSFETRVLQARKRNSSVYSCIFRVVITVLGTGTVSHLTE
jgi:hypothetical protein